MTKEQRIARAHWWQRERGKYLSLNPAMMHKHELNRLIRKHAIHRMNSKYLPAKKRVPD